MSVTYNYFIKDNSQFLLLFLTTIVPMPVMNGDRNPKGKNYP